MSICSQSLLYFSRFSLTFQVGGNPTTNFILGELFLDVGKISLFRACFSSDKNKCIILTWQKLHCSIRDVPKLES